MTLLLLVLLATAKHSFGAESNTLLDLLVQQIHSTKYPHYPTCDVLVVAEESSIIYTPASGKYVIVSIGRNSSSQFLQLFLRRHSSCVILVAKMDETTPMKWYLDLLAQVSDSTFIFWGPKKFDHNRFSPTEKSIIHVLVNHDIGNQEHTDLIRLTKINAEILVLCRRKTEMENSTEDGKEATYQLVNYWKGSSGLLYPKTSLFRSCKHSLSRKTLEVSYNGVIPYIIKTSNPKADPEGMEVDLMRILAKRFHFIPKFREVGWGKLNAKTGRLLSGGVVCDVANGNSAFGIGLKQINAPLYMEVDYTTVLYFYKLRWATRNPQRVQSYGNLARAFPWMAWALLYGSLFAISIVFAITYITYRRLLSDNRAHLVKSDVIPWMDFFLFPISRFVAPDPLPWFPNWSTGKFIILLWSIFTIFMVFFYTCNLRAQLIYKTYEKPIITEQDVINRGKHIYVQSAMTTILEKIEIFKIINKTKGGLYNISKSSKLPDYAREDVMRNGAVYLTPEPSVLFEYMDNKSYGIPNIQLSQETYRGFYFCGFSIQKFVPWKRDVDRVLGQLRDMGFVDRLLYLKVPVAAMVKWSPKEDKDVLEPLTPEHLLVAIFLLAGGLTLGLTSLLAELAVHYFKTFI